MIGSFWNLCRACPSMPVDKLHSEYRSTYRWHEFTGNPRPEVVRRAPAPNPSQFVGPTNEPPLHRRKKCPELAYKSHEFIIGSEYTDARSNVGRTRVARSEERNGTPSRRSKSEGPPIVPNGRAYPIATEIDGTSTKQAGESNGLFKKTITKFSTEYRLQFVWPNVRRIKGQDSSQTTTTEQPKKSLSMGAIKSNQQQIHHHHHSSNRMMAATAIPTVHKKRTTNQKEATLHELEPLVSDAEDRKPFEKQVTIVEKKSVASTRPFSQTFDQERINHFITKKENFGFADAVDNKKQEQQLIVMNGSAPPHSKPNLDLWFKEVVELRKKADEYKCRGWGIEIDPELYKKQRDLWEQVSKRSSLSALSLASTMHRPITKEEKEQENNKKSIPLEKVALKGRVPGQAFIIDNKNEISALPARFSNIRHHLERTTGPDVEEGALLPSPTREKLMPAITKRESESQRGSPKKTAASRHGSPQKGSPQKGSPKKVLKTRSQSVGPENESPKRQIRASSTTATAKTTATGKKTPTSASATERKPRPSTLSTAFHSRSKSSSLPPSQPPTSASGSGRTHAVHPNQSQSSTTTTTSAGKTTTPMRKTDKDKQNIICVRNELRNAGQGQQTVERRSSSKSPVKRPVSSTRQTQGTHQQQQQEKKELETPKKIVAPAAKTGSAVTAASTAPAACSSTTADAEAKAATANAKAALTLNCINDASAKSFLKNNLKVPGQDNKLAEYESEDGRETGISILSASPQPATEIADEPIVKSPPEPTRVKSPEQIIMRSPDPVNWTVPLDTGKTFTVTQNVKEGENYSRPQSEIKASTPVEKPPPPPQSAPPELTEQTKMDAWNQANKMAGIAKAINPKTTMTSSSPTAGRLTTITVQPTAGAAASLSVCGGIPATVRYETKPIPGTTLRCLDDDSFEAAGNVGGSGGANTSSSSTSASTATTARTTAADVLEKARDRFDRFWAGNKEDNV